MEIAFTKMVGAGNDFVVIDNRDGVIPEGSSRGELIRSWCTRRLGVGADGALLVETDEPTDFRMRYYNADGGEAEMCGNGGRCIARFAYINGIVSEKMTFTSMAGVHEAEILDSEVKLGMTPPCDIALHESLDIDGVLHEVHLINTGVPHVIEFVDDVDSVDVTGTGSAVRYHERFQPAGTNANFVQLVDERTFRIRTYERGVEDETLACGTGTTGAAILGSLLGRFSSPVTGITRSGLPLTIHFNRNNDSVTNVFLQGEARIAFSGTLLID